MLVSKVRTDVVARRHIDGSNALGKGRRKVQATVGTTVGRSQDETAPILPTQHRKDGNPHVHQSGDSVTIEDCAVYDALRAASSHGDATIYRIQITTGFGLRVGCVVGPNNKISQRSEARHFGTIKGDIHL